MMSYTENYVKKIKPIYFFWLGVFFISSAPVVASVFLLISIFSSFKSFKEFFKERCNYPLIASTIFMIIGAVYIKFDQSFFLQKNFEWKPDFLILGLFNWIPFFWLFWAFQIFITTQKQRFIFALLIVSSTIPVLISGFGQYWFDWHGPFTALNGVIIWYQREIANGSGMTSLFNNQNYAAAWLSMAMPFSFACINNNKKFVPKVITTLISVSIFIGIINTHSRSAFICGVLAIFSHLYIIINSRKKIYIFSILISILGTIVFVEKFDLSIFNINLNIDRFSRSFNNLDLSRVEIWEFTLNSIFKRPFLGWGSGSFPFAIKDLYSVWKGHPHNILLEIFFSYGIFVGITLSFFIINIFIKSFKEIFQNKNKSKNKIDKYWYSSSFILLTTQMVDIQYFDLRFSLCLWILLAGLKNISFSEASLK